MLLTYKYKLYKTKRTKHLDNLLNTSRNIYNHCIALHKRYYRIYKKHLNIYQLQKHLTKLKKIPKYQQWNIVPAQSIQAITERIEEGYKLLFKGKKNGNNKIQPPGFKSWKKFKSIPFKTTGYKFSVDSNILTIRKKYKFKFWKSREIDGSIRTMTLKKDGLGDYYTHVSLDSGLILNPSATGKTGGCDFGLKTFIKTSDDTEIISPLPLFNNLAKLRKASKQLSSKKVSKNRQKAKLNLIRVHKKINNQRNDFHFKAAIELFKQFDEVKFEDLNLKGMQKLWGRKINDLGFANFIDIIEIQSKKYLHKNISFIDRFFPSSKLCSNIQCRNVKVDLSLKDRTYYCLKCGLKIDRDLNAALNIRDFEMGHRLSDEIS